MLHVRRLFQPDLDAPTHRLHAMKAGLFYAACGMEEVWLLEAIELLRDVVVNTLGYGVERDLRPLNIVLQRITLQRQWQLESMRELQRRRVAVLAALNALAWSAQGYLELIQGAVDILVEHDEIIACAVGRPEASGELAYEAVAGEAFAAYLRALVRGEAAPIGVNADSLEGVGPSGRAWREVSIQRCAHYGSDPSMQPWRKLARQMGVTSSVAIPLCPLPRMPAAVLTLYSAYAGGFKSEDQDAFVEQIRTVLDLALSRLAPPRPGAELLPFFVRERWRNMVTTDSLQMHYQPVVRLADGRVTELEALARLRDDDGSTLMPGRFLAALGDDELLVLFREGFLQAAACRQTLASVGHLLDISVNVPAAALEDPHYVETTAAVLAASGCPPAAVLLEILESPIGSGHSAALAIGGMQALKALGVRLVEDDLGAGYSSLIRLRQWPFDRVKIDQALVLQVVEDPLRTLRFIRQLIRLGHDLDLEVVVEGLETNGLIEAAVILGADLGQGYALARPMAAESLPGWLAGFRMQANAATPVTALGALAAALFWGERLAALPAAPLYWKQHAEAICAPLRYLQHGKSLSAELVTSHAAMHEAAVNGPLDPTYRKVRGQFITRLIEQVYAEEKHQIFTAPVRPA
jgi:EAL domain-containing protein (putative c-di-GMP-specific phosphodiesterase class I)